MRKLYRAIIYTTLVLIFAWVLLLFTHYKVAAKAMFTLAVSLFSVGLWIAIIWNKKMMPDVFGYDQSYQRQRRIYNILMFISVQLVVLGYGMRYFHFHRYDKVFTISGFLLLLLAIILIMWLTRNRYKHILPNEGKFDLSSDDLDKYLGTYANEQLKMDIVVSKKGTSLSAQATGQAAFSLWPIKENIFNYLPAGIVMEFHPEKNEFILIQQGGYFPFIKK